MNPTKCELVLIRGLPGSGKTTLAMGPDFKGYKHFEADMYFMDANDIYNFDRSKIKLAHKWCYDSARRALSEGYNVVVSNTFCRLWEMEQYRKLASELKVSLRILVATGNWKNVHGCPEETIEQMRLNWEDHNVFGN